MSGKIPKMTLGQTDDELTSVLKELQNALLKYPVASQALIASFAEEGREYIKTEEGSKVAAQLAQSELLRRVWRVWEATSLWMFDDNKTSILPSGYVDTLFRIAADEEMESKLEEVIRLGEESTRDVWLRRTGS